MDSLLGVVGKDFVLVAADTAMSFRNVLMVQANSDKLYKLDDTIAMLMSGEPGDVNHFAEFIQCNIALYKMMHGSLSPKNVSSFIRKQISQSLRSSSMKLVNMLIAGYDHHLKRGQIYRMDYLGGLNEAPFAFEGFCSNFGIAVSDRLWRPEMVESEALSLINKVIFEISTRITFGNRCFFVRRIDKDGIHTLDNIYPPQATIERPLTYPIQISSLSYKDESVVSEQS